jgi:hypothetical protein
VSPPRSLGLAVYARSQRCSLRCDHVLKHQLLAVWHAVTLRWLSAKGSILQCCSAHLPLALLLVSCECTTIASEMNFANGSQGGLPGSITQGPDGLLHLAEVAASLDGSGDPAAARALAEHISASVTAFSQALAAQLVAANGPARNTQPAALPQPAPPALLLPQLLQQVQQQAAPPQPPSPLRVNAENASDIAAALLEHLASLKGSTLSPTAPRAAPQQQHSHAARHSVAGAAAAAQTASAAAHRSNAALQAALARAGPAAAPAHGAGYEDQGLAAFMPVPSARLPHSSRGSPVQQRAAEEEDSDYSPTGINSSSGGAKPQQWTDDEQVRLEALVAHHGTRNWSTIAARMPGRTGKQCRERYINNTPELKKVRATRSCGVCSCRIVRVICVVGCNRAGRAWCARR